MSLIKKQKEYEKRFKLEDLTLGDIDMLAMAASIPQGAWFCFGPSFYKLYDLDLIDKDNSVTFYGKQLIKSLQK